MIVRLFVAVILLLIGLVAYFLSRRKYKKEVSKKQADWQKALDCMSDGVKNSTLNGLPLADDNYDCEVSKAIQMISLPDDIKIVYGEKP